jgi:hypothetical protein
LAIALSPLLFFAPSPLVIVEALSYSTNAQLNRFDYRLKTGVMQPQKQQVDIKSCKKSFTLCLESKPNGQKQKKRPITVSF